VIKKSFWLMAATAAILAIGFSSACDKDDDPIDSEIIGSGHETFSVLATNDNVTIFGGTSWVEVTSAKDGQTSTKKYEVQLKDTLKHLKSEVIVTDFPSGDAVKTFAYKQTGEKQEQSFITVKDSVLTINFVHGSSLSFSVDLTYQSATYDDSKSKAVLDYFPINQGNVVIGSYTLTDLDAAESNGTGYDRKRYERIVTYPDVDGSTCELKIDLLLKKEGNLGDLINAEMVAGTEKITVLSNNPGQIIYLSEMKLKQIFSSGMTKIIDVSANLEASLYVISPGSQSLEGKVAEGSSRIQDVSDNYTSTINQYVSTYTKMRRYITEYSYFTIFTDVTEMYAKYDDGSTSIELPKLVYNNLSDGFTMTQIGASSSRVSYDFRYTVIGDIASYTHEMYIVFNVITPAE
jgi:hypothetical protein